MSTQRSPEETPCPRCGAIDQPILSAGTGPHACKASCASCGRFLRWISLLAPSERMAHRLKARLAAMATYPPSAAQLSFLQALGFEGPAPATMAEASARLTAAAAERGTFMTQSFLCYPGPTSDNLACVPDALTQRPQWVLWRGMETLHEQTGELKLTKVPYDPQTLHKASTTDPSTWGTFAYCVAALPVALEGWEQESPEAYCGGGLGYVFTDEDPYTGIDFDHCVDPMTGAVEAWAQVYVDALASYAEITPSHTGLHIIVEGTLPPHGRKKGPVEMYTWGRFFTMTGWHLPDTPPTIEARQDALTALHLSVFGPPPAPRTMEEHAQLTLDDTALLAKAHAAKNSAKFATLWAGDTSLHAGDDSSADLALCCQLAFWTPDPGQIDRLFRLSGLMRKKWDAKRGDETYGTRTITAALALQNERYHPRRPTRAVFPYRPPVRYATRTTPDFQKAGGR